MPPKKACKNAFYYYMIEFRDKRPGQFNNLQEVAQAAGEFWQRMNANERKPYETRAKGTKNVQKVAKYTSTGENIELVQKQQMEMVMKEQHMKDYIIEKIHLSVESGMLPDEPFYVIHINYFCYCNANKRYYPAEIGIAKFNLRTGIIQDNLFNMICKPGSLPLGYLSLAKQISEDSHQIPPPMSSETDYNLDEVAYLLWKFISKTSGNSNYLPPVYAAKKNQAVVENVLSNFSANFGYEELKTYSLEYLFFELRNNCREEKVWVAPTLGELELEKDKYEGCSDISCPYHIYSDVPNHCSQSHVIRTVYTICDNCCADVGIELIPGQHVPKKANTNIPRPHSRTTSCSSVSQTNVGRPVYDHGYLSRAESDYSAVSETSTVVDAVDFAAVGGFDSEFSQADTEEWFPALPESKGLSAKQPLRRPTTQSAVVSRNVGKGRGKGIAANFLGN
ncbi:hypothetical protein RN001_002362 [Aquatica leii]|uniref:HMG box domain-containing protein n=1 Tax=Aquatica leii TaxID=1421715 RepID=A0AAN7PMA5_9COLE|nr:hypothetical protein RN001_002362 [Aquatica leii]